MPQLQVTRARIERHIYKLSRGLGVQKGLKGVYELKIDIGPGYRVYYAFLDQKTLVVLIGGGDKSSQSRDIVDVRRLWEEFEKGGHSLVALRAWKEAQQKDAEDEEV
jgi:putative addiction module killer protein